METKMGEKIIEIIETKMGEKIIKKKQKF